MSEKRLSYLITAAAATLFVGTCYLLFKRTKAQTINDVLDDVRRLGQVNRLTVDGQVILERSYFCNLSALVTFHQRLEFKDEKATLVKQRFELYKQIVAGSSVEEAYQDVVMKIYFSQETVFNQLFEEVLDSLGIVRDEFKRSQVYYSTDAVAIKSIRDALKYGKPDAS